MGISSALRYPSLRSANYQHRNHEHQIANIPTQDKHAKQLADKLAARLARCETERQWSDVAYALSLLQHKNEDITKMVAGGFKIVQASA